MKVLGCDPATQFGWAYWDGHSTTSGVFDLRVKRDESGGMRLLRLKSKLNEIYTAHGIDLVVFEAARNAGPKMQGALVVQAEIQGILKAWCEDRGIQYRGYSPTEIKKHATGKGNANKQKMIDAANEEWHWMNIESDDEADALWVLDLGRKDLGE